MTSLTDRPFIARHAHKDSRLYWVALWWCWLSGAVAAGGVTWMLSSSPVLTANASIFGFVVSFVAAAYVVNSEYKAWERDPE